jgi:A/G-specific adenine glycosylase
VVASAGSRPEEPLVASVIDWYDRFERPLPWRGSTPWGVLVSEFMLQQTPVDRVLPVWDAWLTAWPSAPDLAAASLSDALRAWGRLGYPRRARRLHQSAVVITSEFGGEVPTEAADLRSLPGVGEYTAAAVQAFAFGRRSVVMDTNVRRVLARTLDGRERPSPHITSAERQRAEDLWPREDGRSARWSAAVMEFGALVCSARRPDCQGCPLSDGCAWTIAGQPAATSAPRRQPEYVGSDRQARGRIMAALRARTASVPESALEKCWPDAEQRDRALASLIADGLVVRQRAGRYALPTS